MSEREKFLEVLNDFDDVMLVTHHVDGHLDARPMHVARVEEDGDMWFLTDGSSGKIAEIRKDSRAQVVGQHEDERWVSVAGTVEVVRDRGRIESLWAEPYRAWFPDGVDDPKIVALAFRADRGEYWDNAGVQGVEYALKVAKAYVTGARPWRAGADGAVGKGKGTREKGKGPSKSGARRARRETKRARRPARRAAGAPSTFPYPLFPFPCPNPAAAAASPGRRGRACPRCRAAASSRRARAP
jgi:general stress protein 26